VSDSATWKEGYGSVGMTLINARQDYVIWYETITDGSTVVVAIANVTTKKVEPLQAHWSLTNSSDEMVLMWNSGSYSVPKVHVGHTSGTYDYSFEGTSATYTHEQLKYDSKSSLYFWDPGQIHKVILKGLQPGVKYFYIFGTADAWSNERWVVTPRDTEELSFLVFGDTGVSRCLNYGKKLPKDDKVWCTPFAGETFQEVTRQISSSTIDFSVHLGDLSYANAFGVRWDQFFLETEKFASSVAMLPVPGNHDLAPTEVAYYNRFHSPENGRPNSYYSRNFKSLHIVVINTEIALRSNSLAAQMKWLEKDLQSVDHEKQWLVVFQHIPMYTSIGYDVIQKDARELRNLLETLYEAQGVDLVLAGHVHQYERTCAVVNGVCMGNETHPDGPVHIATGNGGMSVEGVWTPLTNWSLCRSTLYGYVRIDILNRGQMNIQFLDSKAPGTVADSFTLKNPNYQPPVVRTERPIIRKEEQYSFTFPKGNALWFVVGSGIGVLLLLLFRRRRIRK